MTYLCMICCKEMKKGEALLNEKEKSVGPPQAQYHRVCHTKWVRKQTDLFK